MPRKVRCPQCGREMQYEKISDIPDFPFCSKRCRMVDLDKWFDEDYKISEDLVDKEHDGDKTSGPSS